MTIAPWMIAPWTIAASIIAPWTITPKENCPLAIIFSPKIIVPTQAIPSKSTTSELKAIHCL